MAVACQEFNFYFDICEPLQAHVKGYKKNKTNMARALRYEPTAIW